MIVLNRDKLGVKLERLERVFARIAAEKLPVRYIICQGAHRIAVGLDGRR
jgi:hypothetical protein